MFLTGICKFILKYFCVGVATTNDWAYGEVTLWLFFLVFQIIEHNYQQHILQLNFDSFWFFANSFSMVSAGFSCIESVVLYEVVLLDGELSVISMF